MQVIASGGSHSLHTSDTLSPEPASGSQESVCSGQVQFLLLKIYRTHVVEV